MLRSFLSNILTCASICTAYQFVLTDHHNIAANGTMNVAIIGAGAAGSSTAYHLSQFAAEANIAINLTVFERNSYVGGRSTTVDAYDDPNYPIELGASIFVKVNHILVHAAQDFNLTTSLNGVSARSAHINAPALGIWDGNNFVLTLSESGSTWWDKAKFVFKYGLSPFRAVSLTKSTVGKFLTMYESPIFPFASLTHAARKVDLLGATSTPGIDYLLENGVSALFAHDVIQASSRVNYAQNLQNFHGLETMVCMATDGAMAIEGGNWQIFDRFISASTAKLSLNTTVSSITPVSDGSYAVKAVRFDQEEEHHTSQTFDAVVLAAPYQYSGIDLGNGVTVPQSVDYVKLHVTLFTSRFALSPSFFGLLDDELAPRAVLTTILCEDVPEACFSVNGTAPQFFSISAVAALENPATGMAEYAYKIFSPTAPRLAWLYDLLGVEDPSTSPEEPLTWIHRKVWHSYPLEVPRDSFEDIELHDNLWYTGGMESFISTMETNALMGKNVARLMVNKWAGERGSIVSEQTVLA